MKGHSISVVVPILAGLQARRALVASLGEAAGLFKLVRKLVWPAPMASSSWRSHIRESDNREKIYDHSERALSL